MNQATTILDFGAENGEDLNHDSETIKKYNFRDFPQFKANSRFQHLRDQQKKISSEFVNSKKTHPLKLPIECRHKPHTNCSYKQYGSQSKIFIQTIQK